MSKRKRKETMRFIAIGSAISIVVIALVIYAVRAIYQDGAIAYGQDEEEETELYRLQVGDTELTMSLPVAWGAKQNQSKISGIVYITKDGSPNGNVSFTYSDSGINTGDMTGLQSELDSVRNDIEGAELRGFDEGSFDGYAIYYPGNEDAIALYQNIGGSAYFKIELQLNGIEMDAEDAVERFCINVN